MDRSGDCDAENTVEVSTVNTVENISAELEGDSRFSEIQKKIILAIASNERITIAEIGALIGKDKNAVNYQLKKIKKHISIGRVGSDKSGSWKVQYYK